MASSKSGSEVKAGLIRDMGMPLGEMFHRVSTEFTWLSWRWREYSELFAGSPKRIEILNASAPWFFRMVQETLWFDILLGISRLAGPSRTGKNENLSLRQLPPLIQSVDLRADVESLLVKVDRKTAPVMVWRNKFIAHRDLAVAMAKDAELLPQTGKDDIDEAVAAITKVLNAVQWHFQRATTAYDLVAPLQGAEALLYVLRDGVERERERRKKLEAGHFDPDDPDYDREPI